MKLTYKKPSKTRFYMRVQLFREVMFRLAALQNAATRLIKQPPEPIASHEPVAFTGTLYDSRDKRIMIFRFIVFLDNV